MKFSVRHAFQSIRDNTQFLYGIILFVLIPAALVINTVWLTTQTSRVMDVELQRKASLSASVLSESLPGLLDQATELQDHIVQVAERNEEIRSLDVLVPVGEHFRIVASLDTTKVGQLSTYLYNTLAWQTGETIAYQTNSAALSTEDPAQLGSERFWVVVRPALDTSGEKVALISMKVSSAVIDDLTQSNLNRSLIVLSISIVFIILLLANNIRLYQNARLLQKIKEIDRMKDEFISMASHELRAPITGIRGYVQMLLEGSFGQLPTEAAEKLKMVNDESDRLHNLVEDLLEVSRIEQGRISLELTDVNVGEITKQSVNTFQQQAEQKGLQLVTTIQPDLPLARADGSRLQQVLVNLISNALKYTMHGKVTVSVDEIRERKPYIRIKVSDTGIGISQKDRERLFEKFYRVRSKETDEITGTGLGLWITREIVRLMGGDISLDSIEHVGTHVTVTVPIAKPTKHL